MVTPWSHLAAFAKATERDANGEARRSALEARKRSPKKVTVKELRGR
jgi:hypothetical protein